MIKKVLLAGSALSLAIAANAELEHYVIKDGKFFDSEFVKSSLPDDSTTVIKESKNDAGDPMVEICNPTKGYTSGMVYLKEAVDLNKTWMLEVEYYFNKDVDYSGENLDRESMTFDLMADTAAVDGAVWGTDPKQAEYRISHVAIDCSMRDFYEYTNGDSLYSRHGVGVLRTVKKYVYSSLLLPAAVAKRGDANQVKAMFISALAPGGKKASCFIKNLKFVSEGTKPFYADKFTPLEGEGTIYVGSVTNYVYGTYSANTLAKQKSSKKYPYFDPTKMYGQNLFVAECTDPYYSYLPQDRMYCKKGEQGEAGFYDVEYGFLPYFIPTTGHPRTDKTDVVADAVMRIPLGTGAVDKIISIAVRLGHNAGDSGDGIPYADYKSLSKDIRFPMEYRFESGDATKIDKVTDWAQFTPSYTKGGTDKVDSIPTMMSMVYGDVELPSQEYSYIALRFVSNDIISYMFTDLTLTGDKKAWPTKTEEMNVVEDFAGFKIPGAPKSAVENVVAKGEISIYPNPASDVITVANEGVKSVAVYTVAGSLVASSESNTVNVANLVKGIYVVKANTEAGVITGQIIKK